MLGSVDWLVVVPTFWDNLAVTAIRTAWDLKVGPLLRNVGSLTINLGCVTSQKSVDLIYAAKEAWNQANTFLVGSNQKLSGVWKIPLNKTKTKFF